MLPRCWYSVISNGCPITYNLYYQCLIHTAKALAINITALKCIKKTDLKLLYIFIFTKHHV